MTLSQVKTNDTLTKTENLTVGSHWLQRQRGRMNNNELGSQDGPIDRPPTTPVPLRSSVRDLVYHTVTYGKQLSNVLIIPRTLTCKMVFFLLKKGLTHRQQDKNMKNGLFVTNIHSTNLSRVHSLLYAESWRLIRHLIPNK